MFSKNASGADNQQERLRIWNKILEMASHMNRRKKRS